MKRQRPTRAGFTLVELLTVIGIIAVLAGLTLSVTTMAMEKAARAKCTSNMQQIGFAIKQYRLDKKRYPRSLYELAYGGYFKNKDQAACPDDDLDPEALTSSKDYTSGSYTKKVLLQSSYDVVEYGAADDSLWNYNGYDADGTEANTVQSSKYRLQEPRAPETTLVTHCVMHRKTIDSPQQGDIDIGVRLDGSAVSDLKPAGYDWATQP